jgi:hypothetical protein
MPFIGRPLQKPTTHGVTEKLSGNPGCSKSAKVVLVWLFALAGVRLAAERLFAGGTARWQRSARLVNQPLQPQAPTAARR